MRAIFAFFSVPNLGLLQSVNDYLTQFINTLLISPIRYMNSCTFSLWILLHDTQAITLYRVAKISHLIVDLELLYYLLISITNREIGKPFELEKSIILDKKNRYLGFKRCNNKMKTNWTLDHLLWRKTYWLIKFRIIFLLVLLMLTLILKPFQMIININN